MKLDCPRCSLELLVAEVPGTNVYACKRCGGVWIDTEAAQRIATALEPQLVSLADAAAAMGDASPVMSGAPPACPVCATATHRVRVEAPAPIGTKSIELDVCALHGTWFDRNELQQAWRSLHASRPAPPPPDSIHVVGTPVAAEWDSPPSSRKAVAPASQSSSSTVDGVQLGLVGIEIAFDIFTILT
jgi:Zn-finger nucleic acid-binding protein